MNFTRALKWAFYYKTLSWIAAALGLGLFAVGWVVGLGGLLAAYQSGDITSALSVGTIVPPLILTLLGFVVWQLGKTVAFYRTLTSAIEGEMAERFDAEMVKSDILSVLDERLEEMHQEIESTNRAIRQLEGPDPAAQAGFETGSTGQTGAGGQTGSGGQTGASSQPGSGGQTESGGQARSSSGTQSTTSEQSGAGSGADRGSGSGSSSKSGSEPRTESGDRPGAGEQ